MECCVCGMEVEERVSGIRVWHGMLCVVRVLEGCVWNGGEEEPGVRW